MAIISLCPLLCATNPPCPAPPLLCAVNPPHPSELIAVIPPPASFTLGDSVIVPDGREGIIAGKRLDNGVFRVLVECMLDFPVPQYHAASALKAVPAVSERAKAA